MICRTSDRTALSRRTLPITPFSASRLWGGSRSGAIRSADMAGVGGQRTEVGKEARADNLGGPGSQERIGAREEAHGVRPWAWLLSRPLTSDLRPLLLGRPLLEG